VKPSRAQTHSRVHRIPSLRFEPEQRLTSYAGIIVFQALFQRLRLKERLRRCYAHLGLQPIYGLHTLMVLLIVHLLLGFRRLRGLDYYRHDPLVARVVGLRTLPDVSTVSRALASTDVRSVDETRALSRALVAERLATERFARVTLDFDGSVQSTTGHAEGTAVGFNKVKKGARSYYPLFCTVAQTGQFWDLHHRPGNVHDSNGAPDFLLACVNGVRSILPRAILEARQDAAFFDHDILRLLHALDVEFTCSVPFERFPELKRRIESRTAWETIDDAWSFFEDHWRPKSWTSDFRFLFLRQYKPKQRKGPLQLHLFEPVDHEYEYKVIVTDKTGTARSVLLFHNGRGSQEKILGEGKQHAALDLVATRGLCGNQLFTVAGMMAHNLTRELQMSAHPPSYATNPKRPAHWDFLQLGTLRQRLLHLAGRLTRPQGELTLTLNDNPIVKKELLQYLNTLHQAAA
jgi:hypothetical protein